MKRYKQDYQLTIFELVKKVTQLQFRKLQLLQLQILFVGESLGPEAKIWISYSQSWAFKKHTVKRKRKFRNQNFSTVKRKRKFRNQKFLRSKRKRKFRNQNFLRVKRKRKFRNQNYFSLKRKRKFRNQNF